MALCTIATRILNHKSVMLRKTFFFLNAMICKRLDHKYHNQYIFLDRISFNLDNARPMGLLLNIVRLRPDVQGPFLFARITTLII